MAKSCKFAPKKVAKSCKIDRMEDLIEIVNVDKINIR